MGLSTQATKPSPRLQGDFGKELIRITAITVLLFVPPRLLRRTRIKRKYVHLLQRTDMTKKLSFQAANPSGEGDAYSVGDTITIDFNIDTNEVCCQMCSLIGFSPGNLLHIYPSLDTYFTCMSTIDKV